MAKKRREFLSTVGKATMGLSAASPVYNLLQGCTRTETKKWNIVFILSDDQGWNQVGYHGSDFYETPNIDRIAREGMFFSDAYASAPVCSPTRASLMTGKHPARLHITDYLPGSPFPYAKLTTPKQAPCLPLQEITIAEMLKKNGYVTGHFGKWHVSTDKAYKPGRPFDPGSQGFDDVLATVRPENDASYTEDAHHAVEITKRSIDFIESNKDKPFFCYVSHHVVHRPLLEDEKLISKYRNKPGSDQPQHNPIMGAMLERMDTGIGEILQKLDELNLAEKTIVIFYSDNGGLEQLQKQDPLRAGKATIFEGGIRVPMAIRWPDVVVPNTKSTEPVNTEDFYPTILDMVGIGNTATDIDGKSLMPLLKQAGGIEREALYWHYPHYHHQGYKPGGAIRMGDYKLIEWYEESLLGEENPVNLYDLRKDIGETNDLAKEMPEKATELSEKLRKWRKQVGAQEMRINPNYDPEKADARFL